VGKKKNKEMDKLSLGTGTPSFSSSAFCQWSNWRTTRFEDRALLKNLTQGKNLRKKGQDFEGVDGGLEGGDNMSKRPLAGLHLLRSGAERTLQKEREGGARVARKGGGTLSSEKGRILLEKMRMG